MSKRGCSADLDQAIAIAVESLRELFRSAIRKALIKSEKRPPSTAKVTAALLSFNDEIFEVLANRFSRLSARAFGKPYHELGFDGRRLVAEALACEWDEQRAKLQRRGRKAKPRGIINGAISAPSHQGRRAPIVTPEQLRDIAEFLRGAKLGHFANSQTENRTTLEQLRSYLKRIKKTEEWAIAQQSRQGKGDLRSALQEYGIDSRRESAVKKALQRAKIKPR